MSGDLRGPFLYNLPPSVLWEFCRIMDGLSDLDWTRFASEVLGDQIAVRLAERRERRTDWVMNHWGHRNGRVGELIDLLECLQLLRPRDVILSWASGLKPSPSPSPSLPPPPPPPPTRPPPPTVPPSPDPSDPTCRLSTTDKGGGRTLPRPAPPPPDLKSDLHRPPEAPPVVASGSGVMCWSYEEVHAGTAGFCPSLQVGEGGFGVVYRATLRKTDCAVKRLKQDCLLDLTLLKESFQTEVDQLSKFRHPNIVDLLGFCKEEGSVCLIYSYMENRSLEDRLHNEGVSLSWSQRLGVVEGASAALQFLHSPPGGHKALIHGDVKSSNILLDRHLVAKLADFGLARFVSRGPPGRTATKTASIGQTATVRGTLAYLPDEYVRNGELGTALDVYSFGVVLLEVLTGRRALEKDRKSGERYLKDLVEEVEDSPTGSPAAAWRKQLDHRLITGGAAELAGCMEVVALACRCLDKKRKKRPAMTEVFDKLQDVSAVVRKTASPSPSPSLPRPPRPLGSSVGRLSDQLSKLGPLEDTYQSSHGSSSFCFLTPPNPLHSSSSLPPSSSSSSSFGGPCETDESRGFSQYDLRSPFRSNGTSSGSLSSSPRPARPTETPSSQPSVPTEDQYNFPAQPSSDRPGAGAGAGARPGPDTKGQSTAGIYGVPECISPAGPLQSASPEPSVHMNPRKQRFLQKKTLYEEGKIQTPELLSSDDLYGGRSSDRGPEESDELDYLPVKHD
ncbi:interleukin-1 receptor-associated kinase 1 isoform X2 [Sander lucioperca]|uniref:interleukin-1 receptor-associated kinase 1 isoform X2 n=1 Tax=Sander lucioperca TaxID=283035 RepID=UPI001653DB82|nr:interleukin-1 receptor-associated kinase 1 isoform X2 [Sander lucioperca]